MAYSVSGILRFQGASVIPSTSNLEIEKALEPSKMSEARGIAGWREPTFCASGEDRGLEFEFVPLLFSEGTCLLCCPAHSRDLDTADEATYSNLFDWHFESWLLISLPLAIWIILCSQSSVVGVGVVTAVFQIAYGGEKDGNFKNSVQFWGGVSISEVTTAFFRWANFGLVQRPILSRHHYGLRTLSETVLGPGPKDFAQLEHAASWIHGTNKPRLPLQDRALAGSDDTHQAMINGGPTRTASILFGKPKSDRSATEETKVLRDANAKGIVVQQRSQSYADAAESRKCLNDKNAGALA
ncbi:integral membrane protein [Colletotrichum asianum]